MTLFTDEGPSIPIYDSENQLRKMFESKWKDLEAPRKSLLDLQRKARLEGLPPGTIRRLSRLVVPFFLVSSPLPTPPNLDYPPLSLPDEESGWTVSPGPGQMRKRRIG